MTPCASQGGVLVTYIIEASWEEQDGMDLPSQFQNGLRAEGWRPAQGLTVLKGRARVKAAAGG